MRSVVPKFYIRGSKSSRKPLGRDGSRFCSLVESKYQTRGLSSALFAFYLCDLKV